MGIKHCVNLVIKLKQAKREMIMATTVSKSIPDDFIARYVLDEVKKRISDRVMEVIRSDIESIIETAVQSAEAKVESIHSFQDHGLVTRAHFTWEVNDAKRNN